MSVEKDVVQPIPKIIESTTFVLTSVFFVVFVILKVYLVEICIFVFSLFLLLTK